MESLKAEFKALFIARSAAKKSGKLPKAVQAATLDMIECSTHLDSKAFKRLLSYMRWRFLKTHTSGIESIKEPSLKMCMGHAYDVCLAPYLVDVFCTCSSG